jgi:(p)ppGpp synthase/HD superfamily hydrolase
MSAGTNGEAAAAPTRELGERFDEALLLACRLHREQRRKGTEIPYVAHLLGVASLVLEHGGDEDQAIAALLHDAAEDQGGEAALALILDRFGPAVVAIVSDCTDTTDDPKPPWRARKEEYIAGIEDKDPRALLVSLADKVHNARAIVTDLDAHGPSVWQRFTGRRDGSLWYYGELAAVFERRIPGPLSRELKSQVERMGRIG